MQNDPKNPGQSGRGSSQQGKTSFVGKSAAERRAERRSGAAPAGAGAGSGRPGKAADSSAPVPAAGGAGPANRTLDRRAERERERRRQRLITTIIIAVIAIGVVVGLLLITRTPDDAPVPETATTRYGDLIQSRNTDGYPLLGNATAPVVVSIYSAFDCLDCKTFHDAVIDGLVERVRGEQIAVEFVPLYGRNDVTNGQGAAIAAVCASQQNRFWAFQDMLYSWLDQFPANLVFRNNRIIGGVNNIGLDVGAYEGCRNSGAAGGILERARVEASGLLNFANTPTVAINGVVPLDSENQPITDALGVLDAIDEAVARVTGASDDQPAAEATPEITPEAALEATPEVTPEATDAPSAEATDAPAESEATLEVTPEATP